MFVCNFAVKLGLTQKHIDIFKWIEFYHTLYVW